MRSTDSPLTYVFANPDSKRVLYTLETAGRMPYEAFRRRLGLESQTFYRITRRLAQFALVHLRSPVEGPPRDRRFKVELELSRSGKRLIRVLREMDQVIERNKGELDRRTVASLLV